MTSWSKGSKATAPAMCDENLEEANWDMPENRLLNPLKADLDARESAKSRVSWGFPSKYNTLAVCLARLNYLELCFKQFRSHCYFLCKTKRFLTSLFEKPYLLIYASKIEQTEYKTLLCFQLYFEQFKLFSSNKRYHQQISNSST